MRDIIAICRSSKKARVRTSAVLDTYLWRIGDRTWRGKASDACLNRIYADLKSIASKNMAVSIHDAKRRYAHEPPLRFVGSKRLFSASGVVPIAVSGKPLIQDTTFSADLRILQLCAALHDVGKGFSTFQEMIWSAVRGRNVSDPIRHEALSAAFSSAFLRDGDPSKSVMRAVSAYAKNGQDGCDADALPDLLRDDVLGSIIRMVASHHTNPTFRPLKRTGSSQNNPRMNSAHIKLVKQEDGKRKFPIINVESTALWHGVDNFADLNPVLSFVKESYPLLSETMLAGADIRLRIPLIIADRTGSSKSVLTPRSGGLLANTKGPKEDKRTADDLLTHTRRVMSACAPALKVCRRWAWPGFDGEKIALNAPEDGPYAWQSAYVKACGEAGKTGKGIFGVLMSGTGSGKTLAGLMGAASTRENGRITTCLGLRSLTEQTAKEYAKFPGMLSGQVCRLIGGAADMEENDGNTLRTVDDESAVVDEGTDAFHDTDEMSHDDLKEILSDDERRAVRAPALVCTIDHLIGAAYAPAGILSMKFPVMAGIRLSTSDLILDEVDQYGVSEIPPLLRLARICGAAGNNLFVMSATIRPELAEAFYAAFSKGREEHARATGGDPQVICVAASDAESAVLAGDQSVIGKVRDMTRDWVSLRPPRRISHVIRTEDDDSAYTDGSAHADAMWSARRRFRTAYGTPVEVFGERKNISVGLIRMTRIKHAIWAACHAPVKDDDFFTIKVLLHANMPRIIRAKTESFLAKVLTGKDERRALIEHLMTGRPEIAGAVRRAKNVEFLVVSSPVIETGNDFDFDWAILDAPTQRSAVQGAGRVFRNREAKISEPNVALFNRPWQTFAGRGLASPGLEDLEKYVVDVRSGRKDAFRSADIRSVKSKLCDESGILQGEALTSCLIGNGSFTDRVEAAAVRTQSRDALSMMKNLYVEGFSHGYLSFGDFRAGEEGVVLVPGFNETRIVKEWTSLRKKKGHNAALFTVSGCDVQEDSWLWAREDLEAELAAAATIHKATPAPAGTKEGSNVNLFFHVHLGLFKETQSPFGATPENKRTADQKG